MRIIPYGQLSAIKQHQFYTISYCVSIVTIGHASCTCPNKRVCPVFDKKTHRLQSYNLGYDKTGNN